MKVKNGRVGESGDDLVLCGELEEDLRVIVGQFASVQIRAR